MDKRSDIEKVIGEVDKEVSEKWREAEEKKVAEENREAVEENRCTEVRERRQTQLKEFFQCENYENHNIPEKVSDTDYIPDIPAGTSQNRLDLVPDF